MEARLSLQCRHYRTSTEISSQALLLGLHPLCNVPPHPVTPPPVILLFLRESHPTVLTHLQYFLYRCGWALLLIVSRKAQHQILHTHQGPLRSILFWKSQICVHPLLILSRLCQPQTLQFHCLLRSGTPWPISLELSWWGSLLSWTWHLLFFLTSSLEPDFLVLLLYATVCNHLLLYRFTLPSLELSWSDSELDMA